MKKTASEKFMKRAIMGAAGALTIASMLAACGTGAANNSNSSKGTESSASAENTGSFDSGKAIDVISREDGSGTRGAFVELFGVQQENSKGEKEDMTTSSAAVTNSTEVMLSTVASDTYSIGYCSLGSLNDTVKAVKIDGAAPSVKTIKDGSYKIARPFNIMTGKKVSKTTQDFIDYIMSADGQAIVEKNGYISVAKGEKFKSTEAKGKVTVAGSSSVSPVMEKLAEAYQKVNTNATVEVQTSDSTTGISSAAEGSCDIGMASRELKDVELKENLKVTKIATDGIAVIVNKANTNDELTSDQVKSIYLGEATEWSALEK